MVIEKIKKYLIMVGMFIFIFADLAFIIWILTKIGAKTFGVFSLFYFIATIVTSITYFKFAKNWKLWHKWYLMRDCQPDNLKLLGVLILIVIGLLSLLFYSEAAGFIGALIGCCVTYYMLVGCWVFLFELEMRRDILETKVERKMENWFGK